MYLRYCGYCSKKFGTKRSWLNHNDSKQHKKREAEHVKNEMKKVKKLKEKATEKGEGKPTKDRINKILRSPVRPRRHITGRELKSHK